MAKYSNIYIPGNIPARRYRETFSLSTHLSSRSKNVDFVELHRQCSDSWRPRQVLVFFTLMAPYFAQNFVAFSVLVQICFSSSSRTSNWSFPLGRRSTLIFLAEARFVSAKTRRTSPKRQKYMTAELNVWSRRLLWLSEIPSRKSQLRDNHVSINWSHNKNPTWVNRKRNMPRINVMTVTQSTWAWPATKSSTSTLLIIKIVQVVCDQIKLILG